MKLSSISITVFVNILSQAPPKIKFFSGIFFLAIEKFILVSITNILI